MRRIGVKGEAIAGFKVINLARMVVVNLSLKHINELDAIVLKRSKSVGFCCEFNQIGLDDNPAGVRTNVPEQVVLVPCTRARAVHVQTAACLDQNGRTLLLKPPEE